MEAPAPREDDLRSRDSPSPLDLCSIRAAQRFIGPNPQVETRLLLSFDWFKRGPTSRQTLSSHVSNGCCWADRVATRRVAFQMSEESPGLSARGRAETRDTPDGKSPVMGASARDHDVDGCSGPTRAQLPASSSKAIRRMLESAPGFTHRGFSTANGIRTRVTAVRGRRPSPLDDGGSRCAIEASKAWRGIQRAGTSATSFHAPARRLLLSGAPVRYLRCLRSRMWRNW